MDNLLPCPPLKLKTMKKLLLIPVYILVVYNGLSQQNPIWVLPTNDAATSKYLSFGFGLTYDFLPTIDPETGVAYPDVVGPDGGYVPGLLGASGAQHLGAANAIANADGDLLFFIVGPSIFDRHGRTIFSSIFDDNDVYSGYSEIMVVPDPGNCNRYYLFSEAIDPTSSAGDAASTQPVYAILDISEPADGDFHLSAKGSLVQEFTPVIALASGITNYIGPFNPVVFWAASKPDINGDHAIFCITDVNFPSPVNNEMTILTLRLTATGLIPEETIILSDLGIVAFPQHRTEMEVATIAGGNYRLAFAGPMELFVLDIDAADLDYIPASFKFKPISTFATTTDLADPAGLEFSPNGRFIYISHKPTILEPEIIQCYDPLAAAGAGDWIPLAWSALVPAEHQHSFIETGTNGNLYMSTSTSLAEISNADLVLSSSIGDFDATFQPVNYPANYWDQGSDDLEEKRYTLPDQIDGMDYTTWFDNTVECCLASVTYEGDNYTANTAFTGGANQTWTTASNPFNPGEATVYITGTLTIPAGIKVTINNMTLKFHPDAKVVIERSGGAAATGGQLHLINGATLTVDDRCSDELMWKGVIVQGHSLKKQGSLTTTEQGFLNMNNGAKIEHALLGARADDLSVPFNAVSGYCRGGIIRAVNSVFRNNEIDVLIQNYKNFYTSGGFNVITDNLCYFRNNQFITDGLLNIPTKYPKFHVHLVNGYQSGIKFQGNRFVNVDPTLYAQTKRGYGILCNNTKLTVDPAMSAGFPSVADPNEFENLWYGIYAQTGSSLVGVLIDRNEFDNNIYGIYLGSFTGSKVIRNNFEVGTISGIPLTDDMRPYGIYLRGCTGYQVENNNLSEFDDPSAITTFSRGIVVTNSGPAHNQIYRNSFSDLRVGGQSQGSNSSLMIDPLDPPTDGLRWYCNTFSDPVLYDFFVPNYYPMSPSSSIGYHQGWAVGTSDPLIHLKGARNVLSDPTIFHILAGFAVQDFQYVYYDESPETQPITYSSDVVDINDILVHVMDYDNSCPSNFPPSADDPFGSGYPVEVSYENMANYAALIAGLEAQIDGGDTDALTSLIATGSSGTVKTALLAASPYLSDEVLLAYIATNPPVGNLKQVLLANSPLSPAVMAAVEALSLPPGIEAAIDAAQDGSLSPMAELLNNIGYYTQEREWWVDEAIRYYLNDTVAVNPMDSIVAILVAEDRPQRTEQLVDALIIQEDLAEAIVVRNAIVAETGETDFTRIADINIATIGSEDQLEMIASDSAMVEDLLEISTETEDPRLEPRADALLYLVTYSDAIIHPVMPVMEDGVPKTPISTGGESSEDLVRIYPNPANEKVFIEIPNMDEMSTYEISFGNLVGQKVISAFANPNHGGVSVDISTLASGVYTVSVLADGLTMDVLKLVIE